MKKSIVQFYQKPPLFVENNHEKNSCSLTRAGVSLELYSNILFAWSILKRCNQEVVEFRNRRNMTTFFWSMRALQRRTK